MTQRPDGVWPQIAQMTQMERRISRLLHGMGPQPAVNLLSLFRIAPHLRDLEICGFNSLPEVGSVKSVGLPGPGRRINAPELRPLRIAPIPGWFLDPKDERFQYAHIRNWKLTGAHTPSSLPSGIRILITFPV